MTLDQVERFSKRFTIIDGCWSWLSSTDKDGYAEFESRGKRYAAHRIAYKLLHNHIPDYLVIDHLCRKRNCVNPNHLEAVTNIENIRRGVIARRQERKYDATKKP